MCVSLSYAFSTSTSSTFKKTFLHPFNSRAPQQLHLFYYDEVKHSPPAQDAFWLGGVCCHCNHIADIEAQVNEVSNTAFGSRVLKRETEFHGIEICGGKGNFKGITLDVRLQVLQQLLATIASEHVIRGYVKIIPANIIRSTRPPAEIAFMYLVEKVDELFKNRGTVGMLFGDYDEPQVGPSVASLSEFRNGGTLWSRKREITNIIDTVHFARSHHSRLIQLADVYLYCLQFMAQTNTSFSRSKIAEVISDSGILQAHMVRVWPSQANWYR